MGAASLVQQGFGGYQGWGDAEADANFAATGGAGKGQANGSGGNLSGIASSYTVPDIKLSDIGGSAADYALGLNGGIDKAFQAYSTAANNQAKPLDIYNGLEAKAGIPQLRTTSSNLQGQINDLEDTINRVEPTVNSTTTNSLVTEGQRNKMISDQKYPLQQVLTPMSTSLGRIQNSIQNQEQGINTAVGYAVQGNQQALDPLKMGVSIAQDNAARLMSGFTSDRQTQLDLILEKIHAQQHISDSELKIASDAATAKQQYDDEINKMIEQTSLNNEIIFKGGTNRITDIKRYT